MQDQTKQTSNDRDCRIERAIVMQTLRDDHDEGWSRAELAAELDRSDPIAIGDALIRLRDEGVVELAGETVRASRAAMRLNELDIIAL
jgi:hypothetical protein